MKVKQNCSVSVLAVFLFDPRHADSTLERWAAQVVVDRAVLDRRKKRTRVLGRGPCRLCDWVEASTSCAAGVSRTIESDWPGGLDTPLERGRWMADRPTDVDVMDAIDRLPNSLIQSERVQDSPTTRPSKMSECVCLTRNQRIGLSIYVHCVSKFSTIDVESSVLWFRYDKELFQYNKALTPQFWFVIDL